MKEHKTTTEVKSILMIAPWLGIVDRGAETFTKELARQLALTWRVTVVTGGKTDFHSSNIEIIECSDFVDPLYRRWLNKIYNHLSSLRNQSQFSYFFKLLIILWDKIYYLHPEAVYQFAFMRFFSKKVESDRSWDVVFPQNGIAGALWAKKQRAQHGSIFVYTGHGGIGRGEKLVLGCQPNAYFCLSSDAKNWANKFLDNVSTIHNGVNIESFHRVAKPNSKKRVLSVGALTSFKRHELTIKAMALIPDAHLTIVGSGERHNELTRMGESLLPGRFSLISLPYDKMPSVYANADVFVLPSLNEPMGIVYLEALVSGLRVIAPDDSVRREILSNHAIFVDVNNIRKYAEEISSALTQEYDSTLAITYVMENYSWDKIAKIYETNINNLINKD